MFIAFKRCTKLSETNQIQPVAYKIAQLIYNKKLVE